MAEYDSVIPAGKSGKLTAKVHTRTSQHGKLSKSITVTTDAPGAESLRLSMVMDVYASILVKPKHSLYINTVVGSTQSNRVLLTRTDGQPLEVTVLEPDGENYHVKAIPVAKPEKVDHNTQAKTGDVWIEATVTEVKKVTTRTYQIALKTNHPEVPEISIPLTLRVRSLIEARPAQVRLWVSENRRSGQNTIFRLTHNGGESFEAVQSTSSHPEIFVVETMTQGAGRSQQFKVGLVDDLDTEGIEFPVRGFVTVRTTSPTTPEVTVPVLVSKRADLGSRERFDRVRPSRSKQTPASLFARPTQTPGAG